MTNQGAPIATRTTEHPHHLPLSDFAALIGTDPVRGLTADKAMAALKRMASPTARAVRGGSILELPSRDLVQGDVVLLEAGNYVPADLRLVEAVNLRVEEAALTGESQPLQKYAA